MLVRRWQVRRVRAEEMAAAAGHVGGGCSGCVGGGLAYREYGSKAVYCITVRMRSSEGASSIPLPRKHEYPDQSTVEYE